MTAGAYPDPLGRSRRAGHGRLAGRLRDREFKRPQGPRVLDVSWTAPTAHTDGTPLTDLASYRVYYGSEASCLTVAFLAVKCLKARPAHNETVTFGVTGLRVGQLY